MAQDRQFSVIVPLYRDGFTTLDRFLLCLKEQDYKNYELILVYNSPDREAWEFLHSKKSPLKKYKGKLKEVEIAYMPKLKNGNHAAAFNAGAKEASGDYLLFLDPDIYLLPGTLREYKDAFEKYPTADFIYGHYDFEGAGRVEGRPYSEYELKCANYISGAFPIKKSAFRGWDERIQSLQDWDMWLSAVDGGAQGQFIDRPCFITSPPTATGISADSAQNWLDRWGKIRTKHGFPPSELCVTSLGAPLHATNVAEMLGADVRVRNTLHVYKPHEYKALYVLGFYPLAWDAHMRLFYEKGDLAKPLFGRKRLIHWIGTDIYQMNHKLSVVAWRNIQKIITSKDYEFIHLTECEATQKELQELGIESKVIPIPPKRQPELSPLPEKFTVGVYINPTQDMYFEDFMYEVANALPDIDFKFFGNPDIKKVDENKEWVGWVDMHEFLPSISALVRLTVHDGLPLSPLEALMAGRNVLSTVELKHALHTELDGGIPVLDDVVEKIRQMQEMPLNEEGSRYWKKELDPNLFKKRIDHLLK